jgi:rubrerythrin
METRRERSFTAGATEARPMNLEEALVAAIDYERKIRDVYREAAEAVSDPVGRRLLQALGDDEQSHMDYLLDRLNHWRRTGRLEAKPPESVVPRREVIEEQARRHADTLPTDARGDEKQVLSRALRVEIETSDFYRKMAGEMSGEAQALFRGFLEIEDRHVAAVQIELDYHSRTGYWMGIKEFDME